MTDYEEEQSMELEALEAIYGDDYVPSSSGSGREGAVQLVPLPGEGEEENHVALTLSFLFPETYPDVVPEITLESQRGLKEDALNELRAKLKGEAEESVGMPMIFNLAESAKEWLMERNIKSEDSMSMHEQMVERQRKAKEKELAEQKKKEDEAAAARSGADKGGSGGNAAVMGTPVTRETFEAWKKAFDAEMLEKYPERRPENTGKPTGRELFEKNMANEDARDAAKEANVDALVAEVQEASLFLEGDDSDDEDLDFSDESED